MAQDKSSTAKDYYAPLPISELRKLWLAAGGPRRWDVDGYAYVGSVGSWSVELDRGGKQFLVAMDEDGKTYPGAEADCRFVAAAANAIMPLILRIEELEAKGMTTDAIGTSPAGTGDSLAGRPLDPKWLAEQYERGNLCTSEARTGTATLALIIAALRAYEPHVHRWGPWKPTLNGYLRHCPCGQGNFARDLVPVEETP